MKKLLLLITIASFIKSSTAQITYHFPHYNAVWGQFDGVYVDNAFTPDFYSGASHFYVANGDSSLNTYTYIKIYQSDSSGNPYNLPPRLIREDQERVYYFLPNEQTDTLLYDFSLQPGQVANVYTDWYTIQSPTVDSIGFIQIGNQMRKCIYLNYYSGNAVFNQTNYSEADYTPITWIEGIGSNDGLFVPYGGATVIDGISFLTCFRENDTLKFGSECNLVYDGMKDLNLNSSLSLFPNPASGKIFLKSINPLHYKTEIIIYSIWGKELFLKEIQPGAFGGTIDLSGFVTGTYFLKIKSPDINRTEKIQVVSE